MPITISVNGRARTTNAAPGTALLYVLRNDFELNAAKFGCGAAHCGACTVLVDDKPVRSCVTPLSAVAKSNVTTLEGLGSLEKPHRLQTAFIEEQAAQCGYCIPGMIMSAKALLDANPKPADSDIDAALAGNLCRCGTHNRIVRAIKRAVREAA